MMELSEKIYYADQHILKLIQLEFTLIEQKDWYRLYQHKRDNSYWRLNEPDKHQQQYFVRLETAENWTKHDDQKLRIDLLKRHRGTTDQNCNWKNCHKNALVELAFCELHSYTEMGVRK